MRPIFTNRWYVSHYTASLARRPVHCGTTVYNTACHYGSLNRFAPGNGKFDEGTKFHGAHSKAAIGIQVLHVLPISTSSI